MNELSDRESQVLEYISWGASFSEIADYMHISTETVKEHVKSIKDKVKVNKNTELAAYYFCKKESSLISNDCIGTIKKLLSTSILLLLLSYAEVMQLDYTRTRNISSKVSTRISRTNRKDNSTNYKVL